MAYNGTKEISKTEQASDSDSLNLKQLILHNDDYHTFDYVTEALMTVCEHPHEQALQCTFLVHFRGKADVKHGTYSFLKPMMQALRERDLKVTIR